MFPRGAAALASALLVAGCADEGRRVTPVAPQSTIIVNYSTPTATLETLAKGVEAKGRSDGQSEYMGCLADSSTIITGDGRAFHAFFDLLDLRNHPSWDRNRDWNKQLEPVMYSYLARLFSYPYEMTWEPYEFAGNESSPNGSDSLLHRKYWIVLLVKSGGTVTRLPVAIGAADLYFVKSASAVNKWVIALWQDFHTADADSAQVTLGQRRLDTQ